MDFYYKVRPYHRYRSLRGEVYSTSTFGIGVYVKSLNLVIASPLTNYIKKYSLKGKSLNTQKNTADEIVKFLNFCLKRIEEEDEFFLILKEKGFFGLKLIHGSDYISELTARAFKQEINESYVYRIENILNDFYEWLFDENIIKLKEIPLYKERNESPFELMELGTLYPDKRKNNIPNKIVDFGENRIPLAFRFIQIAEAVAPEIAIGVCFQFFGGLRRSEVVNLTIQSFYEPTFSLINSDNTHLILKIDDNQDHLFVMQKYLVHEQVKNPRMQSVLPFKIMFKVLNRHKQDIHLLRKTGKLKNERAFLVDFNKGTPINGQQYYRKFMKVKSYFMKQLSEENNVDFDFLNENNWSTHIGRGVFTNILLERGADLTALKIARGDKSFDSILDYVEEKRAFQLTKEAVDDLSTELSSSYVSLNEVIYPQVRKEERNE